jgi:predicted DNA-binding transcriptional regulator AlpA
MSYTHTLITVKEAAKMLGLAEKTVHNHRGGTCKLTRIRRGRSVRMIRQEVQQHLASLIKAAQRSHEKNDAASTRATASREGCR